MPSVKVGESTEACQAPEQRYVRQTYKCSPQQGLIPTNQRLSQTNLLEPSTAQEKCTVLDLSGKCMRKLFGNFFHIVIQLLLNRVMDIKYTMNFLGVDSLKTCLISIFRYGVCILLGGTKFHFKIFLSGEIKQFGQNYNQV